MQPLPKVPAFNLNGIFRCRDRLLARALEPHIGAVLAAEEQATIVSSLQVVLPKAVKRDVLVESSRYLLGRILTRDAAEEFAWRLAGNVPVLKTRRSVHPWAAQSVDEWVPFQVLRAQIRRNASGRIGADMTFRALAGTACPMLVRTFWRRELAGAVSQHMGFSAPWHAYPYHQMEDLVGLRFVGYVEVARSHGQPGFFKIECPASFVEYNRVNVLRRRVRKDPCPFNYTHECAKCVVGYDRCPAGTHARTYEKGPCDGCGKAEAFFDPEQNSPHCIACTNTELLRKPQ